MRRALALLLVAAALLPAPVSARSKRSGVEGLLSVVTPANRGTASAHPWVNVIVSLGEGRLVADSATFRARIGRTDVTDQFHLTTLNGIPVMRARLAPPLIRTGRGANRLRFLVQAKGRKKRDIDRVRFRAADAPNQPPVARLIPGSEVIVPGVPVRFVGAQSDDPDDDELTYSWGFDDGTTSSEADPTHVFPESLADADVTLTVSDGQLASTASTTVFLVPQLDPGRTPGQLRVEADQALEFGAVAPGTARTLPIRVTNLDTDPIAQVKVEIGLNGDPSFTVVPESFALDPGQVQQVDVTFTPAGAGHRSVDIVVVSAARNQSVVHALAHGFAGNAPGFGPTLASTTLFFQNLQGAVQGITPGGTRFTVDNNVHTCVNATGGGTRDLCVTNADCTLAGETCAPGTAASWEPVDMCTDGRGHLYLLSDDIFTDPTIDDTERSVGILDIKLDANGNRTDVTMLRKTTTQTTQLACDRLAGGSLYIPEYREITTSSRCFRDAQENLLAIRRSNGLPETLYRQLDAIEGFDACDDDIDPAVDLQALTTGDGLTRIYTALDGGFDSGGIYQVLTLRDGVATPRPLLFSPDVRDFFQVTSDGSILYVTTTDTGPKALMQLYRISPNQVTNGPLRLSALTPCATVEIPNNLGRTFTDRDLGSFVIEPGANGRVVLMSFITTGGRTALTPGTDPVLAPGSPLVIRGTYAVDVPADGGACGVMGLVNLEFMSAMRF